MNTSESSTNIKNNFNLADEIEKASKLVDNKEYKKAIEIVDKAIDFIKGKSEYYSVFEDVLKFKELILEESGDVEGLKRHRQSSKLRLLAMRIDSGSLSEKDEKWKKLLDDMNQNTI